MKNLDHSVSLEELANGYCVAIANSYRLVEDGEKLFGNRRFVGAVAACSMAIDEVVRAHLISKAVTFKPDDKKNWAWFWQIFQSRDEKLKFLEREIHPKIFKNKSDIEDYRLVIRALKDDFVHVHYEEETNTFVPPGAELLKSDEDKKVARMIYEYVLSLYKALNIHGMPTPAAQYQIFRHMHEMVGGTTRV